MTEEYKLYTIFTVGPVSKQKFPDGSQSFSVGRTEEEAVKNYEDRHRLPNGRHDFQAEEISFPGFRVVITKLEQRVSS